MKILPRLCFSSRFLFFPFQCFILGFGGCCICKKKKRITQRNCICNLESTNVLIFCEVGGSCSLRLMLSTEVPSQIKHLQKQSNLFLTRRLSELVSLSAAALSVCQLLWLWENFFICPAKRVSRLNKVLVNGLDAPPACSQISSWRLNYHCIGTRVALTPHPHNTQQFVVNAACVKLNVRSITLRLDS